MTLGSFHSTNEKRIRLMNIEYTEEGGRPIVHLFGRDSSGSFCWYEVEGHEPSFYIPEEEYTSRLENHSSVTYTEGGYRSILGENLRKVNVRLPKSVKPLRETFDRTFEADVWFTYRFLIDKGIKTGVKIDTSQQRKGYDGQHRVSTSAVSSCDSPSVEPRIINTDIEVVSGEGFPNPEKAEWPVVSIVAHDSYTDQYKTWVLRSDEWDEEPKFPDEYDVSIYDNESVLLNDYNYWVHQKKPDILTGWNSNGFDYPYLMNRCKNLGVTSSSALSPMFQAWTSRRWGDPSGKGITFFDMLDGYKKTQIHKLPDAKLDTIAEKELGRGKVDIHSKLGIAKGSGDVYGALWRQRPDLLVEYNIRDVEAVNGIDKAKNIVEMHMHMRDVTGALLGDMNNNINMLDPMILHEARSAEICLPTSDKPDEDWYHGAYVFTPKAGLHDHVVYPDLASLYPNMMRQCNMSPETLIGTKADLFMSKYSESDTVHSYIDPRPVRRVEHGESYDEYKDGSYKAVMKQKSDGTYKTVWRDEPEEVKLYYVKPSIKQGFVTGVVDKLLGMKQTYKGEGFTRAMYEAVKRVVNSVYGVFGDSNSYGRGFRLFDHRLAESITLGGRRVIQYSARKFVGYINETYAPEQKAAIVGGDTDSVMTAIPFVSDGQQAYEIATEAAQHVNALYDGFCRDTFNIEEHYMEIEVESYSPRCFFVRDTDADDPTAGLKKRYVTEITIEDGRPKSEPKMNVKGFEMIRSDRAQIAQDAQREVFESLMHLPPEEAKKRAYEWLRTTVKDVREGRYPLSGLGVPFGISKSLHKYGGDRRPLPWYRGAKYANQYIYRDNAIKSGDKPLYFYVSGTGSFPNYYSADTPEDGDEVDCVSVLDADDLPNEFTVDREKMLEKTVFNALETIYLTMGWDFEEALKSTSAETFM